MCAYIFICVCVMYGEGEILNYSLYYLNVYLILKGYLFLILRSCFLGKSVR